ncbi:MAG TPA: prolyl oligopeptidase family serine peptidase [Jatrophihabitantaceae bacterium]
MFELRSSTLLDIDEAGRFLIGNDESGSVQLHELAPDGRRSVLTDLGEPCWGLYLPGQRTVVVSADDGGSERAQLWLRHLDNGSGLEPLVNDPAYIHTLLDVAAGRVLYATNRRNGVDFDLVLRTVSTGAERVIWDGGGWISAGVLSPDGRYIAIQRESLLAASTELMLADVEADEVVPITDVSQAGDWRTPRWLGGALLSASDAGAEFHSVRRYDVAAKSWTILLDADGSDREAWPSPDGTRLAVVTADDGADRLAVYDVDAQTTLRGRVEIALPHAGVISFRANEPHWSPDSTELGLTFASPVQPPDVYLWTGGVIERRTVSNAPLATAGLIQPESHRVPTPDGEHVPVYVYRGGPSVVLSIHGGPEAASVREWMPMSAAMALAGHTVVMPNVRGSAGYGRRWLSLDDVELRLDSVADLAAVHAWLPSIGADPSRAGLYGGSYGGYMVLAGLAFQPELWAAGAEIVGISSLVTFLENTSAYRRAYREREYGTLADDREFLEKASPLSRINDIRAPLFVVHGANDPRVPLSEAQQVVEAVRSRNVECELLVYPDEGHGLAKRANRLDAYPRAIEFLTRHLR